jgi:hypothetical protein
MGNGQQRETHGNDHANRHRPPGTAANGVAHREQSKAKRDSQIPKAEKDAAGRHAPIVAAYGVATGSFLKFSGIVLPNCVQSPEICAFSGFRRPL